MIAGTYEGLGSEPGLHIDAIADIIHELVVGGARRLNDGAWLRERVEACALSSREAEALESLRQHLGRDGELLASVASLRWP